MALATVGSAVLDPHASTASGLQRLHKATAPELSIEYRERIRNFVTTEFQDFIFGQWTCWGWRLVCSRAID